MSNPRKVVLPWIRGSLKAALSSGSLSLFRLISTVAAQEIIQAYRIYLDQVFDGQFTKHQIIGIKRGGSVGRIPEAGTGNSFKP